MEKFDVAVIGAGPAGYAAAMRALDFKKKVCLIERNNIGGAGVTNGALSSKTWWELSRKAIYFRNAAAFLKIEYPKAPFKELSDVVHNTIQQKIDLLKEQIDEINNSEYAGLLQFKKGNACLISNNEIEISNGEKTEIIFAENIVLATGSRPRYLPELPIDEKIVMTSDSIESMEAFPESMVIVGAGVIGCEFATIFSNFDVTKINLIDKGDRILPFEDEDVVKIIEHNLEERGVLIHHNSKLVDMKIVDGRVAYELKYTDGHREKFNVEKALVSVGRVPNIEGLWNENVNIKISKRGIESNETQTNIPNIYAVGDITADTALVNVAEEEGRFAIEKMYSVPKHKLMYKNISTIMFLNPEVSGVGINETQAWEMSLDYKVVTLDYSTISRAIAKRSTQGFIKMLVTNDDEMKILGMKIIGIQSSSTIQAVAILIAMNKGVEELAECMHPHPSITEGVQECVRMLLGTSILKPALLKHRMTCRKFVNGKYEPF